MRKWFRLFACIDVPVEEDGTLKDAYAALYQRMMPQFVGNGWQWESLDKAYGPDGKPIDVSVLDAARMEFFYEENEREENA